jgi:CheY-like chemotaxis protein/anti-sigma regulatory factor (Ser/Thr protein kinase)
MLTPNSGAVIDIMDRQTAHLVRLVDDLLEVSRIAQGKFEFRMQLCDLMEILGTALEACQGNIERKNHSLTTDFSESKLPVLADPIRLAQAFTNVLNNAAKFTRPGGAIRVSAKPSDGYAVVTIADSGVGIPKTALTDIFELFTQLDQPSERNSGLGIGLTLVRDILEAHGGTVEAASAGPNAGSIFTLRVPLAQTATLQDTSKPSAHSGIAPPKRVLVIDDNHDAADLLSKLLESFGATVRVAYDGRTGLAAAEDFCPDIVFIDLGMPGLNGFETAHLLREGARGKQLFIAAITGWGQKDDRAQTAAAGFNAHLTKPASVEALKEVLVSSAPDKP